MEALPPLSATIRRRPSTSTFEAAFRPPSPCQYEIKAAPSSDDLESAYWNPEQETLHYLSSTAAAASSSASSSLCTPSRAKRQIYDVPSADEAASMASTTATSYDSASASDVEGSSAMDRKGKGKAHPLTMTPAVEAAWDFERMFARRRRWDGGSRVFEDEEGGPSSTSSAELGAKPMEGLSMNGGKLSSTPDDGQAAGTANGDEEEENERRRARQRETFETLRKVAMERLGLLAAHLAWSSAQGAVAGK